MKFWHNVWCGDNPLSTCFPDLFRISNDKEASSLGEVFGSRRFLPELHFLFGLQL